MRKGKEGIRKKQPVWRAHDLAKYTTPTHSHSDFRDIPSTLCWRGHRAESGCYNNRLTMRQDQHGP